MEIFEVYHQILLCVYATRWIPMNIQIFVLYNSVKGPVHDLDLADRIRYLTMVSGLKKSYWEQE